MTSLECLMVEEGGHGLCRKNGANVCFYWFACVAFFVCVCFCLCLFLCVFIYVCVCFWFMSAKLRCVFSTDRGSRVLSSDNSFYLTFFVH